jgi:hypothetical protein
MIFLHLRNMRIESERHADLASNPCAQGVVDISDYSARDMIEFVFGQFTCFRSVIIALAHVFLRQVGIKRTTAPVHKEPSPGRMQSSGIRGAPGVGGGYVLVLRNHNPHVFAVAACAAAHAAPDYAAIGL